MSEIQTECHFAHNKEKKIVLLHAEVQGLKSLTY